MCGWPGRRESSWRQRPHLPRPPACRSLPAAEPPCALPRPHRPGLPRRRGPGHVWRTRRRRPGVTYIRDGRPGPPEAPAGPRCASGGAGLCGSGAPGTRWYGRKGRKGGTKAEGRAGVAVAATSAASSSSSSCPRRAPSPTQPSPRSRYVPVPVASPSRSGDNGTARPGSAPRARAPTSLAHPPRGGRDGVGGRRSSREIRSEPPREFSNARDTASGADGGGLRTTVPGMPRGSSFRSRPGGGLSFAAHAGSCSSWAARTGARQSPFLAPAPHLVGTALVPCPVKAEPPAGRKLALRTCIRLTAGAAHPLLRLPPLRLSGFH